MHEEETFKDIQSQIINNRKFKQRNTDLIEPWMDEPQTIPMYLLNTESEKFVEKPTKIRKHASLEIYPRVSIQSPRKQSRPSKELPKKNIGNFTIVKIVQQADKLKQTTKKKRQSHFQLPTLTVTRELAIQRKLYLMKLKDSSASPQRRSIRSIVQSASHR